VQAVDVNTAGSQQTQRNSPTRTSLRLLLPHFSCCVAGCRPLHVPPEYGDYAERKQVFDLLQEMVKDLVVNMPDDPLNHIKKFLQRAPGVCECVCMCVCVCECVCVCVCVCGHTHGGTDSKRVSDRIDTYVGGEWVVSLVCTKGASLLNPCESHRCALLTCVCGVRACTTQICSAAAPRIVVLGPLGSGRRELCEKLHERTGAVLVEAGEVVASAIEQETELGLVRHRPPPPPTHTHTHMYACADDG
jgi:hypothetical protein